MTQFTVSTAIHRDPRCLGIVPRSARCGLRKTLLPLLTASVVACLTVSSAIAQVPAADNEARHETEEETISKCLPDLGSPSVDVRLRAVLILGKYNNPVAHDAVMRALADPESRIRRSALVSITENTTIVRNNPQVLRLIGDPDVHIRRIATSYLDHLTRMGRMVVRRGRNGRTIISGSSSGPTFPPDVMEIVIRAFDDDDETVRKNMVKNFPYFRSFVPKEAMVRRIQDESREVRILALKSCTSLLTPDEYVKAVKPLAVDEDRLIRLQLAQSLGSGRYPAGEAILMELRKDDSFEVSTEALLGLFLLQVRDKTKAAARYEELRPRIDDPQISDRLAFRFIRSLTRMPAPLGEDALLDLMTHRRASYRREALQTYARTFWKEADEERILKLLDDPSRDVRNAAGNLLLRKRFRPGPEQVDKLIMSPHIDVRIWSVKLAQSLPKATAGNVLMELLIDENTDVRIKAIELIERRKMQDWELILVQSLTDEIPQIQKKSVDLLIKNMNIRIRKALEEFAAQSDNTALRRQILSRLRINIHSGERL